MKGSDLLRIVDAMHHEKNIPKEVIFVGIEEARPPPMWTHGLSAELPPSTSALERHRYPATERGPPRAMLRGG